MKVRNVFSSVLVLAGVGLTLIFSLGFRSSDEDLTAESLIQRHLASIAPAERLKERRTFVMKGDCQYKVLVGGAKIAPGPGITQIVSEGQAYNITVKFDTGEYGGEQYVTDGKSARTAYSTPSDRNPMTEFLQAQQELFTEGLFGGELTTAWALLDVKGRKPKLNFKGLEDVDGRQLYELDYRFRKGGYDLTNKLYFEPETFHHVLSTYEVQIAAPMGANPTDSARQRPSRYKVEERFADFKDFDGFTLPADWTIQFSQSTTDSTLLLQWSTVFTQSALDMQIPPGIFKVK